MPETPADRELITKATDADGVSPLNEEALRHLDDEQARVRRVLDDEQRLVGYAQVRDGIAQLVIDPQHRRQGFGTQLATELVAEGHQLWSFGALLPARELAARLGLVAHRELLIMGRPLADLPTNDPPGGLTIRPFTDADVPAILDINARAFSHHPEQGSMDAADFAERCAQDWFRPEGLLVAERDGQVVGFHWTKRRDDRDGEVYVIGVDPRAHGGGIGKTLLLAGLRHLADQGLERVLLWVEGDQAGAVGLYERFGFEVVHRDIVFGPPSPGQASSSDPASNEQASNDRASGTGHASANASSTAEPTGIDQGEPT